MDERAVAGAAAVAGVAVETGTGASVGRAVGGADGAVEERRTLFHRHGHGLDPLISAGFCSGSGVTKTEQTEKGAIGHHLIDAAMPRASKSTPYSSLYVPPPEHFPYYVK